MHASSPHYGDALSENPRVRAVRAGYEAAGAGYPPFNPPGTDPRLAPPGVDQAEWDSIRAGYERMQQSIDHLPPGEQDRSWHPWRYPPSDSAEERRLIPPSLRYAPLTAAEEREISSQLGAIEWALDAARPSSPHYGDVFGQRMRRGARLARRAPPFLPPPRSLPRAVAVVAPPLPPLPPVPTPGLPTPPPPGTIAAQAITPVLAQPNYGGPGSPYAHLNPVLGTGYSTRALQARYQGQSMTGHIWVGEAMAVHELTKIILALTAPITGDYLRFWAPIGLIVELTPTRLGNGYLGSAWAPTIFIH